MREVNSTFNLKITNLYHPLVTCCEKEDVLKTKTEDPKYQ